MQLFTIETVPGKKYEPLALVEGGMVQTKNFGKDFMAGLKNMVGGELKSYTEMMQESRNVATQRMVNDAAQYGADAIVGVRYSSSSIMQGASEVLVYGTAVKYID